MRPPLQLAGARTRAPWWVGVYAWLRFTVPESLVDAFLDDELPRVISLALVLIAGVCFGLASFFAVAHSGWFR